MQTIFLLSFVGVTALIGLLVYICVRQHRELGQLHNSLDALREEEMKLNPHNERRD